MRKTSHYLPNNTHNTCQKCCTKITKNTFKETKLTSIEQSQLSPKSVDYSEGHSRDCIWKQKSLKKDLKPPCESTWRKNCDCYMYESQHLGVNCSASQHTPCISLSEGSLVKYALSTCIQPGRHRHKSIKRMSQHTTCAKKCNAVDSYSRKGHDVVIGEGNLALAAKENDGTKNVFPFLNTPSGNLKIIRNQVVFESQKVSVLVADPKRIKVNIKADVGQQESLVEEKKTKQTDGDFKATPNINEGDWFSSEIGYASEIEQELSLESLGSYATEPIDWSSANLPSKSDLCKLLIFRVTNYVNPDFFVHIATKIFNCHLIVLQCYSMYFEGLKDVKQVNLPEHNVTPQAFTTIYNWMIDTSTISFHLLNRKNILEVFLATQFLGVKELEEQCWAFIDCDELFSEDTAFHMYLKAKKLGNNVITEMMVPRIMKFFLTLVSSKNFLNLAVEELCVILCSNYIAVHCEMEVFMSAVRWLVHDWNRRKDCLLDVMHCIRFGLIAPWQLVDIRRNPENPEFMEITADNDVQQLVEDGLAFAIIKYWYGNQTEDYYHWIELLGLAEPSSRNWIGEEKNYITFRDFLQDLKIYRHPKSMEKTQAWIKQTCDQGRTQNSTYKVVKSPPPTIAEFIAHKEWGNKYCAKNTVRSKCTFRGGGEGESNMISKSEDNLVTPFHSLCGDFKESKESYHRCKLQDLAPSKNGDCLHQISQILPPQELEKVIDVDDNSIEGKVQQSTTNLHQPVTHESSHESYQVQLLKPETKLKEVKDQVSSLSNINSILPMNIQDSHESHDCCSSKEKPTLKCTQQMSVSMLGPTKINYMTEDSLFFPTREAILVFGGVDPHSQYGVGRNKGKDIYRYQPDANSWELVGELPEPRHQHSVAFLKGRVFLVGGADPRHHTEAGKSIVVGTVWSYEPVSRSWFSESSMLIPRKHFGLVVSSGKLYAIGGQDCHHRVLSSVERYDPITGVWEEVAPLLVSRMGIATAKFRDLIWVAGGMTSSKKSTLSQKVECYNIHRDMWLAFGNLRFPRSFSRLISMNDTLYLIGGAGRTSDRDHTSSSVGVVDVWDASAREWHLQTEMSIPRHGHSLAYLGKQILIIGGITSVYMRALSNVECFCCQRGTWIRGISNLPLALSGHGSITLPPASLM